MPKEICSNMLFLARSGVNACTAVGEKLKYENLDLYLQVIRSMHGARGHRLKLWKADIDSAFRHAITRKGCARRCASAAQAHTAVAGTSSVCPRSLSAAWAGFRLETSGLHVRSCEQCPPLGASGCIAIYAAQCSQQVARFNLGQLLKTLARRLFYMPLCRFVDDFFSVEDEEVAAHFH